MMGAAGASGDKVYVDDVFSTFLYDATGVAGSINNGIDLAGKGGMVWTKARDGNRDHQIGDTEQGTSYTLVSNSTAGAGSGSYTAFNSNGYSIGTSSHVNSDAYDYVSWTFRKAPGFFDVVTYTGNGSSTGDSQTISHDLGSTPGFVIIKRTSGTGEWVCWHRSINTTGTPNYDNRRYLQLNATNGTGSMGADIWGTVNSTGLEVKHNGTVGDSYEINKNGQTYVAYFFDHDDQSFGTGGDESIIKCGSFTGANHTESLGFEPQILLAKRTDGTGGDWFLVDNMRGFYPQGADSINLRPNTNDDENTAWFHLTSDGFYYSSSSATYAYMAIRRPNKPPEAATEVLAIDTGNSSSTTPCWDSGFPVDLAIMKKVSVIYPNQLGARLLGTKYLSTNYDNAQANDPDFTFDSNSGWGKTWNNLMYSWMFKRAPGFMDVVAYSGLTGTRNISHNLGVAPELYMVKNRDSSEDWQVYSASQGATKVIQLNENDGAGNNNNIWGSTSPTSSVFTVGNDAAVNVTGNKYIALLFATLPGISKVGSYTGTGNDINVDCGFTSGARFVLIKRTNSNGNWVLFDSLRGIVSGDDPYIKLNTTSAQTTDENHLAPLNAGFTVSSSSEGDTNANGGTYIFLAIA